MSYGGTADPSGIQVTFLDQTGEVGQSGHRLQRARQPDHPQHHYQDEFASDQS